MTPDQKSVAEIIHEAMAFLPPDDGVNWHLKCQAAIDWMDGVIKARHEASEHTGFYEYARQSPKGIALEAMWMMPFDYRFGTRDKWLRRLGEVCTQEREAFDAARKLSAAA